MKSSGPSASVAAPSATRRTNATGAATGMLNSVRSLALTSLLVLGVSGAGVAIGVFGVAPFIESPERAMQIVKAVLHLAVDAATLPQVRLALGGVALLAAAWLLGGEIVRAVRKRTGSSSVTAKVLVSARTPRDVEALAAAGTNPVEIAKRTRMPVDAVSMLLQLGRVQVG